MAIAKHTPGPWEARADRQIICAANGRKVAKVDAPDPFAKGKEWREENEYCEGNARLIKESPEMYGLLCSAVRELDQLSQANRSDEGSKHPLATKIRSLLARLNA